MASVTRLLRRTTTEDVSAIVALESSVDTATWLGPTGADWHEAALRDPSIRHYLLLVDEAVGGFAVVAVPQGRRAELRRVVVDPVRRGQGLGRWLVESVLGDLRDTTDCPGVWLDVKKDNRRAQTLYRSLGFVESDAPDGVSPDPTLAYFSLALSG